MFLVDELNIGERFVRIDQCALILPSPVPITPTINCVHYALSLRASDRFSGYCPTDIMSEEICLIHLIIEILRSGNVGYVPFHTRPTSVRLWTLSETTLAKRQFEYATVI